MAPNPTLILTAPPRLSRSRPVRDLRPIDQYAALFLGVDFGLALAPSVTISIPLIACSVYSGIDAAAPSRILGSPALAPSLQTGIANQMVVQLIGLMLPTAGYKIQCFATTSEGETVDMWGIVFCCPIPVPPVTHGTPLVDALGNILVDANGNPLVS